SALAISLYRAHLALICNPARSMIKKYQKTPTIPQEREETIRQKTIGLLTIHSLTIGVQDQ
ncbi:MAG: hypothetical protein OEU36_08955, partial [Gammaproteobacteria bacterium]|nr:hypothetical protein [Gammaproteobacteria bacterium]